MINNRHFHLSRIKREKEREAYMGVGKKCEIEKRKVEALWQEKSEERQGKWKNTSRREQKELILCAASFECLINTWSNLITNKSHDAIVPSSPRSFNEHSVTRWLKANWKWWWQRRSSILLETRQSSTLCKYSERNHQRKYKRARQIYRINKFIGNTKFRLLLCWKIKIF